MARTRLHVLATLACVAVLGLLPARLHAQAAQSLGSVTLSKKVMANGQPLAAGTYTVRLANDSVSSVVGQSPDGEKWVEFVQGGQVKGKELATVVTGADAKTVLKGKAPAAGTARVDMLKGADYVRVWINKGGSTYLIHLTLATS
ncbi:MAG TPA: hypothetical protein VJN96_01915 [Vicinamibacterales bacterium]|nr:hypothetical protein [Vicinamibacterales bacterium]